MIRAALALVVALSAGFGVAHAKGKFAPIPEVDIPIPSGWNIKPNPDGPLTIGPGKETGDVLQFSKLPVNAVGEAKRIGLLPFAKFMANGIGWNNQLTTREGTCGLGRYAFVASTGEFKTQLLWMTASADAVYLWTWIASNDAPKLIAIADNVVRTARLRKP